MRAVESKAGWLAARNRPKILWIAGFVVCIWLVEIVNMLLGHQFNSWGLYPRSLRGLVGIFLAPFLHYGFHHVIANTVPFIVLGSLVIVRGARGFLELTLFIVGTGGMAVWLLGRPAYHVGASGLIMGYFGFLFARGWYERRLSSAGIALFVFFLYGGLILSVLPGVWGVSWEMHLFGFIAGVIAAKLLFDTSKPN